VSTSPDGTTNSHQPVKRTKIANPIHRIHLIVDDLNAEIVRLRSVGLSFAAMSSQDPADAKSC
jgi:hypothetical protein